MVGHHDHGHGHGHSHAPKDFGRAFAIGTALNLAFVVVEAGFGIAADSVALLADAGHNLSDVLGLLIAWGAATLAKRPASQRYTYGLKSSSILAALANAMLLFVAVGAILLETVQRLGDPPPVQGMTMVWVAAVGIAVILSTGFVWIDPLVSLVIVAVILGGTWGLFKDSLGMALNAVPPGIDPAKVSALIEGLPGVARLHDLHIWPMSTTENALTAHIVMPGGHPGDAFLTELQHRLDHDFGIGHATVQIEVGTQGCAVHEH